MKDKSLGPKASGASGFQTKLLLLTAATVAGLFSSSAMAAPCRVTVTDGFLGVDANNDEGSIGIVARVDNYIQPGWLGALSASGVDDVDVSFRVHVQGQAETWYLGTARSNEQGWAQLPLGDFYGLVDGVLTLMATDDSGAAVHHALEHSQHLQILAEVNGSSEACDGGLIQEDVFGSVYFRHPSDTSPILITDVDDTLFNSSDPLDILRTVALEHYFPLDNAVVTSSHTLRNAGVKILGITGQNNHLRPFTRSEMLWWAFDAPYELAPHQYDSPGYDGTYRARTLTYLARYDYPVRLGPGVISERVCDYKIEKLDQLVDGVFGGHWEHILGFIGDSEGSDGCASRATGIHWYALMEEGTQVEDTSDPSSYTEITGGWIEALPILCDDGALICEGS